MKNVDFVQHKLIGLDVGGTKVEAIAVDRDRTVIGQVLLPMESESSDQVVESIKTAIHQVLKVARLESHQVFAAGLGIPGHVKDGIVQLAVNLNLEHYPLAEVLSKSFKIPFILENDVRTAALGAYDHFNAIRPIKNLAYLGIGTGIAAGLILDGKLYRGSNGMAGEIGHAMAEPSGPECKCGMRGCLEILASGSAIALRGKEAVESGQNTLLQEMQPLDARAVYRASEQGDPIACQIIQQVSIYLARSIQWMIMAYDVDKLVLGGGVTHEGRNFIDPILAELARLRAQSELARLLLADDKIALFPREINAGLWGAIALAKREFGVMERR